ncbi:putative bifunctional diguanylate cyclase/phosphodiesterase [Noviherbaspirillum sp.]|uniref:putative bifunctional diguanylate cyclase/phosphodiesterase n=1 Tax=Noviherbaspirillum sp. TaxID=1926288 RepID=UPI002B4A8F54|nr:EAL domain-containing protein [Noviherbaspirillum sp.]HJV79373.1 EAL domain-containing protein [Noviherbaspirillum sp.]
MSRQINSLQNEMLPPNVNGEQAPNATVLGRLLVIQQMLDALPNEERMGEFARRALMTVPGVADVYVNIHGHTVPPNPDMEDLCKKYEQALQDLTTLSFVTTSPAIHFFPLRTEKNTFGLLLVRVSDESLLNPYLGFFSNICNAIGIVLETRMYQAKLARANESLRQARDELEVRVAERTRELEYLVTHDRLTDLPNRILLIDRLQHALASARRNERMVAVIYLDLDNFTYVNTGLGTACGDEILKEIAHRLSSQVRENDTVARIGSDEFVIILTSLENKFYCGARLTAILTAVREPMTIDGNDIIVTCSIGACFYPLDGDEHELLLRQANAAMHRAKTTGKAGIQFFAESRDSAVIERMQLEAELRKAISNGGLVVHYQPKLDLRASKFCGAEALVRWLHPVKGLIQPSDFIPLAEESMLIISLGEWVLMQACLQVRIWQEAGIEGAAVAVNLSVKQFCDGHIVEIVRKVLRDTGIAPWRLELEITESSIMHDLNYVIELMHELKQLGVSISIDDFGTGYSNLSSLRILPADKLKIDKSFVHEIDTMQNAAAVALAVIAFAKSMGMRVVAEGVETAGQAKFLHQHGCDEIQGYLISRPVRAEQAQELISRPYVGAWSD